MIGSYASLEGGFTMWGVKVLTGDYVRIFHPKNKTWVEQVYNFLDEKSGNFNIVKTNEIIENDDIMFLTMLKYAGKKALMSVSWDKNKTKDGLISGHA